MAYDVTMRDSDAAIIRGLRQRPPWALERFEAMPAAELFALDGVSTDDGDPAEAESAA